MNMHRRLAPVLATLLAVQVAAAYDPTLRLAEFAFDPLRETPALPLGWDRSQTAVPDLHLVQLEGPVAGETLERLRESGLAPVQYVFPDTYVTWGRAADRARLEGQPQIRWTGDFAPAYRVQPALRELGPERLDVRVLIYRGAHADTVRAALSKLGPELGSPTVVDARFEIAAFRLRGDTLRLAAAIPGVYSIQPLRGEWAARGEVAAQIDANNLDELGIAVPGYQDWLDAAGVDGSEVTVAVVDEGIDESHPDLAGSRLDCTGRSCTTALSNHGTHVAGIVTGNGASGAADANGFLRGLGIAPQAGILEQEFVMFRFLPGGVSELISDSARNGATISNNSWGTSVSAQGYDADALLIDAGVRDADPSAPGNQPLLYVQAFGNGSGGVSSQGAPDEAKNIVVVGSTLAIDTADGNPTAQINDLSSNTAHGPALDGRRIPHLVAPGCYVDSTLPDLGGGPGHGLLCGTSMAAPQVSAAAALFTQRYRDMPGVSGDPSPALSKAALLIVAHDLAGYHDADGAILGHRPDHKQGWGRLDLAALLGAAPDSRIYYDQQRIFEESGENWLREVTPVDPQKPMRILLAWTDAPGHGLGGSTPAWNNDLDLVVEAGAATYRGNVFGAAGWSVSGGSADFKNNAEGVFLALPPAQLTIRVEATNINSDGVPGAGDETDQDFALVCDNCAFAPGFDLEPHPVTAHACAPATAEYVIDVEQHAGFASPVTLSLSGVPGGSTAAFDVNPVGPGGQSLLSIATAAIGNADIALQLQGQAPGVSRSHPLYLRVRSAVPQVPATSLPASGAQGVSPQPTLAWTAVAWAASYAVEVSTDPTFQTLAYGAISTTTTHEVGQVLAEATQYFWRVRARNTCGYGAPSAPASFTTRNVPDVLLVDDDWDYWGNFQADYRAAMDALPFAPHLYPVTYDVWDVYAGMQQQEPDHATLALYEKVIWWSGNEDFYAGPSVFSELELGQWLDESGGCLLVSSSDYVFAREGVTGFMQSKLGVGAVAEDTGQEQVTGAGAAFGGLGTIVLRNVNPDYSDLLSPDATAELAFAGDMGPAAIDKQSGPSRTTFAGFGFERLFAALDRQRGLLAFLQWCDGLDGLDGDGDGVPNAVDCAPGDAGAWTAPAPVDDLRLAKADVAFLWSEPTSGGGAVYDLLRSADAADFWNASCIASGVATTQVPGAWDSDPQPGAIAFYLVRARSACGTDAQAQGTPCE